jgi:hypothetical protein
MRLRLKSEFWAEGSGVGFHVAACKRGVFIHQYSSVLGKPTFSTESAKRTQSNASRNSWAIQLFFDHFAAAR